MARTRTSISLPVKKTVAASTHTPKGLGELGRDMNALIARYLPDDAICRTGRICQFFYHTMQPTVVQRKLEKLAHYIVIKPNEDKVKAMLSVEPALVKAEYVLKEIKNKKGKKFLNHTLFQLAYGQGDPEMCLAMKPFFVMVYGSEAAGIAEMERQRKEKFTEEADENDKEAKAHVEMLLNPVIEAIIQEDFQSGREPAPDNRRILRAATLLAIDTFRESFAKSQPEMIEKGMHFRHNTLQEAFDAYVMVAAARWNNDYDRCALFEDGVLSFVLEYVPVNDAQRFSQGLHHLQRQDEPETFARADTLRGSANNFYDALRGPSIDFVLNGSYIDIIFAWHAGTGGGVRLGARAGRSSQRAGTVAAFYQNLCRTKTSNLRSLCSPSNHNQRLGV